MSFLTQIKNLFHQSADVRSAAELMIEAMAKEAIKTGSPEALMAVANQWEQLQDGTPALATVETNAALAVPSTSCTTSDHMKPVRDRDHATGFYRWGRSGDQRHHSQATGALQTVKRWLDRWRPFRTSILALVFNLEGGRHSKRGIASDAMQPVM